MRPGSWARSTGALTAVPRLGRGRGSCSASAVRCAHAFGPGPRGPGLTARARQTKKLSLRNSGAGCRPTPFVIRPGRTGLRGTGGTPARAASAGSRAPEAACRGKSSVGCLIPALWLGRSSWPAEEGRCLATVFSSRPRAGSEGSLCGAGAWRRSLAERRQKPPCAPRLAVKDGAHVEKGFCRPPRQRAAGTGIIQT